MTGPVDKSSVGDVSFLEQFVESSPKPSQELIDLSVLKDVSLSLNNIQKSISDRQISPASRSKLETLLDRTYSKAAEILQDASKKKSIDLLEREQLIFGVQRQVSRCLQSLGGRVEIPDEKEKMGKLSEWTRFSESLKTVPEDTKSLNLSRQSLIQLQEDLNFKRFPFNTKTPKVVETLKQFQRDLEEANEVVQSKTYLSSKEKYEFESQMEDLPPSPVLRNQNRLLHEMENTQKAIEDYLKSK